MSVGLSGAEEDKSLFLSQSEGELLGEAQQRASDRDPDTGFPAPDWPPPLPPQLPTACAFPQNTCHHVLKNYLMFVSPFFLLPDYKFHRGKFILIPLVPSRCLTQSKC